MCDVLDDGGINPLAFPEFTERLRELAHGTSTKALCAEESGFSLHAIVRRILRLTRFHGVLAPNARLRPLVIPVVSPAPRKAIAREGGDAAPVQRPRSSVMPWGKLMRRVFKMDAEQCPGCGGTLRIIAAIMEREAIERILNHLKRPAQAPPRTAAFAGGICWRYEGCREWKSEWKSVLAGRRFRTG